MAGGDSCKGVARLNEIGDECNCCKHFLLAFRLTAGPYDYRLGSAGWASRHHSLSVFGNRMTGTAVCLGYRREIRASQKCRHYTRTRRVTISAGAECSVPRASTLSILRSCGLISEVQFR
jgi:hypothetical protein